MRKQTKRFKIGCLPLGLTVTIFRFFGNRWERPQDLVLSMGKGRITSQVKPDAPKEVR
jgi:hypothetical protein